MQRIILPFSFVFPFLHTLVTSSHRIPGLLMRGGKKKDSSVFDEVAHTFYSIFLFFFCSSRSMLAFGVNRIRGNSKMREASNEPQTGVVAAEDRFIAPITVCLFFFFIGSFTVKRRLFVSRHAEDVSLFRLFLPVIEPRLREHLPSKHRAERIFFRNRYFCDLDF